MKWLWVLAVGILYTFLGVYYRPSSREMRRINGIMRGKMMAHFSESLAGRSTIRAYGQTERFLDENARPIDLENRSFYASMGWRLWMAARLAGCGNVLVLAVALMCTAGATKITPGQVGLCLSYIATTAGMLGAIIQMWITLGVAMVSVERVEQLSGSDVKQEGPFVTPADPSKPWPPAGNIQLDNISMLYREGLPTVLKGVSVNFAPGERIGIVGRTGAGKTSIAVALFRLAELSGGRILIDGVDIATIGLTALRSAMAIIPQDPELFRGTLRANLDPIEEHDDSALRAVLERAHLRGAVVDKEQRVTLDMGIDDGGKNLSVGHRSLVSLARALLKAVRIMVMDEATAAVDLATDVRIQHVIREDCNRTGKTLLCISHRLRTVIGWDKILVMDAGTVHDLGSPLDLFDRRDGLFRSLCDQSHITRGDIQRAMSVERL